VCSEIEIDREYMLVDWELSNGCVVEIVKSGFLKSLATTQPAGYLAQTSEYFNAVTLRGSVGPKGVLNDSLSISLNCDNSI